ncbi:MAG: hypothetical protein ACTSW1_06155 [Candidatus Hodarchaeales archaeon]
MDAPRCSQIEKLIRQNRKHTLEDDFVLDFLGIWEKIHHDSLEISVADIKDYSKTILKDITIPFYNKYKETNLVKSYEAWLQDYSAIVINWFDRGTIMFPLRLITYEVSSHQDKIYEQFIEQILNGSLSLSIENLFSYLFPRLINVRVPLSETDLLILKSLQFLQNTFVPDPVKIPKVKDYSDYLDLSIRTIQRRLQILQFFQIYVPIHFINMAKLNYETFLVSHFDSIPKEIAKYTLMSIDLTLSNFTILQIPMSDRRAFLQLQDEMKPSLFLQMTDRIHSWNLSHFEAGKNGWTIPPSFVMSDPEVSIITPTPDLHFDLCPKFTKFRELTPADIKLIDFIARVGAISNLKKLSRTIGLSQGVLSERLKEYREHHLLRKMYQFFNVGLDINLYFYISTPKDIPIPWVNHFLNFPKVDVFTVNEDDKLFLFGFLKLPNTWIKDLTRKISAIKKTYPEIKFLYTIEPPNVANWNLSLSRTYMSNFTKR